MGEVTFEDQVQGETSTPQPHYDFDRRVLINYTTSMADRSAYRVFYVPEGELVQRPLATVPVDEPCYIQRPGASAASIRNWATSLLKARGLGSVNGPIQDGSAAVITPAIRRSFQLPTPLLTTILGYEQDRVGLMLFPSDGDVASPDISWSYTGFNTFRKWLARAEGFTLAEMDGFGGDRQWCSVSTTLAPLLDHPDDDGPDLAPAQCAAMLPRLEAILDRHQPDDNDPVLRRRVEDVSQLITVLRFCVGRDVALIFG